MSTCGLPSTDICTTRRLTFCYLFDSTAAQSRLSVQSVMPIDLWLWLSTVEVIGHGEKSRVRVRNKQNKRINWTWRLKNLQEISCFSLVPAVPIVSFEIRNGSHEMHGEKESLELWLWIRLGRMVTRLFCPRISIYGSFFPIQKPSLFMHYSPSFIEQPRDMIVVNRQSESDTVIDDKSQGIGLLWRHIRVVVMWWYS